MRFMQQDNTQQTAPAIKVLIVEDDPSLSKLYATRLQQEGYQVVTAYDGATGLAIAAEESPTLIMLDMMLPKYTGIEFLEQLKQHGKTENYIIVCLTNLTEKKEADRARELGAKEYLAKAMHTPDEIVEKLKKYLQPETTENPTPTLAAPTNEQSANFPPLQ